MPRCHRLRCHLVTFHGDLVLPAAWVRVEVHLDGDFAHGVLCYRTWEEGKKQWTCWLLGGGLFAQGCPSQGLRHLPEVAVGDDEQRMLLPKGGGMGAKWRALAPPSGLSPTGCHSMLPCLP